MDKEKEWKEDPNGNSKERVNNLNIETVSCHNQVGWHDTVFSLTNENQSNCLFSYFNRVSVFSLAIISSNTSSIPYRLCQRKVRVQKSVHGTPAIICLWEGAILQRLHICLIHRLLSQVRVFSLMVHCLTWQAKKKDESTSIRSKGDMIILEECLSRYYVDEYFYNDYSYSVQSEMSTSWRICWIRLFGIYALRRGEFGISEGAMCFRGWNHRRFYALKNKLRIIPSFYINAGSQKYLWSVLFRTQYSDRCGQSKSGSGKNAVPKTTFND